MTATMSAGWPDISALVPADVLARITAAAATADREGQPAKASLDELRACGFPGVPVPSQFGGRGATLLECCAVQRALGAADPGLAVAVNMHMFSVGLMVEHWRRRADVSWIVMEAIATQQRLLASAFAEPQLGGSLTRSTIVATRVTGGWQVSGIKAPCSLAAEADLVCLQVRAEEEVLVALLPTTAPGLSVQTTWDTLGMRGSASNTLRLDDCVIPNELVFYRAPIGAQDDDVVSAGLAWFCLTAAATYLGVAQAALAEARRLTGRLRIAHLDAARSHLPSIQAGLGDHVAALHTIEASCRGLASELDDGGDPENLLPACLGLKQHAMDVIPAFLAALVEACGGVAYARSTVLERLWRDVQAIRFHPPTRPAARQFLGRHALGVPAYLDLDEDAPRLRRATGGSA